MSDDALDLPNPVDPLVEEFLARRRAGEALSVTSFCAAHAEHEAALRELLDQQPVLGQEPGVVDADAVRDEAPHVAAVRRIEAKARERLTDRLRIGVADLAAEEVDLVAGHRLPVSLSTVSAMPSSPRVYRHIC